MRERNCPGNREGSGTGKGHGKAFRATTKKRPRPEKNVCNQKKAHYKYVQRKRRRRKRRRRDYGGEVGKMGGRR